MVHYQYAPMTSEPEQRYRSPKQKLFDYTTTLLLLLVWAFLVLIVLILLGITHIDTRSTSDLGAYVTWDEITGVILLDTLPILFAAVINEMLVDRAWRRVNYFALGDNAQTSSATSMAAHLRAANFSLWTFAKRFFGCKLTIREWRSAISYALLRWGTTASIASAQLAVTWVHAQEGVYIAQKRHVMLAVPVLLHAMSVFGAIMVWAWPWTFFSDRFHDGGLLDRYRPYLHRVQGSLASFEEIACVLEGKVPPSLDGVIRVKTAVRSGRQISAKLAGMSFGVLAMFVPPALAWGLIESQHPLTLGEWRFVVNLVFLSQNVFYVIALDFVLWNISLDGFCKTPRARENTSLRHLGYSSGIMHLVKACRQRRPIRAMFFMWTFWIQACGMRLLTVVYSFSNNVLSRGTPADMEDLLNSNFWIGWAIITGLWTFPLFLIWLLKEVDAPVCAVDGWRWANIAQDGLYADGYYGIKSGRAVWAQDVQLFSNSKSKSKSLEIL